MSSFRIGGLHERYGCGRATATQLPFLFLYMWNAAASVLLAGYALQDGSTCAADVCSRLHSVQCSFQYWVYMLRRTDSE